MAIHPSERYRLSLPVHPEQHRCGAVLLPPDPRDFLAPWHPSIAARLSLGSPADSMGLLSLIKEPRLDQGNEGSCVAGSTEGSCQMAESAANGSWPAYAIHQLYTEAGGTGQSGVDVRTVMSLCIKNGTPKTDGTRDAVIRSYLFVDPTPGSFRAQAKASIAAGHPVLIACLLPIPFGWNSGTVLSQGYHQWVCPAFSTDARGVEWAICLNDWNDTWPGDAPANIPRGVGRITFDALEQAGQRGYLYGVIPTNDLITPPPPPPPLLRAATITGRAEGPNEQSLWPVAGQKLAIWPGVTLTPASVVFEDGPPPPPPGLAVSGYSPNPVPAGTGFTIYGSGFTADATASFNGKPLFSAHTPSPTQMLATAPGADTTVEGAVVVTQAAGSATGPPLTVLGGVGPPPPPPGAVDVHIARGRGYISAVVQDRATNAYLSATCHATAGARDFGQRQTRVAGNSAFAAVWAVAGQPAGTVITVSAVTEGELTGSSTITL